MVAVIPVLKVAARLLLAPILAAGWQRWRWAGLDVTRSGHRLKPGITAVVAARNEEYLIPFCLRSLVGIADQIVCIDNGSDDGTLDRMHEFETASRGDVDVDVLSMPGALLGQCREAGLQHTRHRWHLRWDADMVAHTGGEQSMAGLRQRVLQDDRPRAIQLPRTNLHMDLRHTHKLHDVIDPGEPILIRFSSAVCYREYGKFDTIRVPFSYRQTQMSERYYMHCAGLKSDDNLLHRFHYFAWREAFNAAPDQASRQQLADFEAFKTRRNMELFGTNEPRALKFRFQRQLAFHCAPYDPRKYGPYPDVLHHELACAAPRFEVLYQDGHPYTRIDRADRQMLDYVPTSDDLAWDPTVFLARFLNRKELALLGIQR